MARRTVRVTTPISKPDEFMKLVKDIIDRHLGLINSGNPSPLDPSSRIDMVAFQALFTDAGGKLSQSRGLKEKSENVMEQAQAVIGTGKGQNVNTPGTLYHVSDAIKSFFLNYYKGNEEAISEWGWNVVVGKAKSPKRKPKP